MGRLRPRRLRRIRVEWAIFPCFDHRSHTFNERRSCLPSAISQSETANSRTIHAIRTSEAWAPSPTEPERRFCGRGEYVGSVFQVRKIDRYEPIRHDRVLPTNRIVTSDRARSLLSRTPIRIPRVPGIGRRSIAPLEVPQDSCFRASRPSHAPTRSNPPDRSQWSDEHPSPRPPATGFSSVPPHPFRDLRQGGCDRSECLLGPHGAPA